MRLFLLLGVFLVVSCLAACGGGTKPPSTAAKSAKPDDVYPVEVAPVTARVLTQSVVGTGSVQAFETVKVTARVAGTVDRLLVTEGDQVALGQSIAVIDGERFRLAVEQAAAQAQRAVSTLEIAQRNAERRESLAKQELVRTEELEQARAQVAQAIADRSVADVAVQKAKLDLTDATVLAPIAGVIQDRQVVTGSYVQPGTVLATLIRRDPLLVRFPVTIAEAALLRVGQAGTLSARGMIGGFSATVGFIAAAADPATRLVTVQAAVADPEQRLRPGAFAEVRLDLSRAPAPAAPELALRASERGVLAYVVEGDVLRERAVVTGTRGADGWVEIRSGLAVCEALVVRAGDGLKDGLKVRVVAPRFPDDLQGGLAGSATKVKGSGGRAGLATGSDLQSLGGGN
jgi:multidrug efflux system membrane fusion protein